MRQPRQGWTLYGRCIYGAKTQRGLRVGRFHRAHGCSLGNDNQLGSALEIEMRDAYFDQWGFSVPDFVANTLGASLPVLHAFFPRTRALQFKWSYHPSNLYLHNRERSASDLPHVDHLIDDYEGMTFWASLPLPSLSNKKRARPHLNGFA